jgi:hypothetical protein
VPITIDIPDAATWPVLRRKVEEEIDRRTLELKNCPVEALVRSQAWIAALEWVLDAAKPPEPEPQEGEDDEIYA